MALIAALAALALPQGAAATVYDKFLYDELVSDGVAPEEARCVSALSGARVALERYVEGYFVSVVFENPTMNPQQTDADGNYSWELGDGDYRVSVTKNGYWRAFSGIVTGPGAIIQEHVALKRRPGTLPPEPRDCGGLEPEPEPAPAPEPETVEPADHEPKAGDPDADAKETCLLRPVNARVRGAMVRKVVFSLDGRVLKRVSRPDADGVFGVEVERTTLPRGKHVLRAKVMFVRRADRRPELLRLAIRRCPERLSSTVVKASPRARCGARPFLAWVRANRVRRVFFRLDGRKLGRDSVADWQGRYGVMVNPARLRKGTHVVAARIEFVRGSDLRHRTVRLRFRKCD